MGRSPFAPVRIPIQLREASIARIHDAGTSAVPVTNPARATACRAVVSLWQAAASPVVWNTERVNRPMYSSKRSKEATKESSK